MGLPGRNGNMLCLCGYRQRKRLDCGGCAFVGAFGTDDIPKGLEISRCHDIAGCVAIFVSVVDYNAL